jgi:hypothetical protein
VECFELRDASGGIWAEILRENTGKLQLAVRNNVSRLSYDHRLYLFSPDGQQLSLHPQSDAERYWISCAGANLSIRLNLNHHSEAGDILGLVAPVEIGLRWVPASPDYFRLLQVE